MCTERHILLKKIFPDELNMGLPLRACVEKKVYVVETHRLTSKKKVQSTVVSKEGHADSLLEHEKSNYYRFQVTINSHQLLRQNSPHSLNDSYIRTGQTNLIFNKRFVWFGWVLWHINHSRLFNAKSSLYIYIKYIEFGLFCFYGISTIVSYLMPYTLYIYIYDL